MDLQITWYKRTFYSWLAILSLFEMHFDDVLYLWIVWFVEIPEHTETHYKWWGMEGVGRYRNGTLESYLFFSNWFSKFNNTWALM